MTVKNKLFLNNGDGLTLTGAEIEGESYTAGLNKRDITFMSLGNRIITKNNIVAIVEELEPKYRENLTAYVIELGNYEPLTVYAPDEDTLNITSRMNLYQNAFFYIGNNIFNKQNITGIEKVVVTEVKNVN